MSNRTLSNRLSSTSLHRRAFLKQSGILGTTLAMGATVSAAESGSLQAGAAAVDISPKKLPVICNGGFLEATANRINDPLHARAVVLDDGSTRLALAVVDVCILETGLCNRVRKEAAKRTGIPFENIVLCATHTHSAGSVLAALGQPSRRGLLRPIEPQLVEVIAKAAVAICNRPESAGAPPRTSRTRIAASGYAAATVSAPTRSASRRFAL